MPGGNRTGPNGMGPKTGRAAGYCSGSDVPGSMNPTVGRGGGFRGGPGGGRGLANRQGQNWGAGRGGGRQSRFYEPVNDPVGSQQSTQALQEQMDQLQTELSDIRERIGELKSIISGGKGE